MTISALYWVGFVLTAGPVFAQMLTLPSICMLVLLLYGARNMRGQLLTTSLRCIYKDIQSVQVQIKVGLSISAAFQWTRQFKQ